MEERGEFNPFMCYFCVSAFLAIGSAISYVWGWPSWLTWTLASPIILFFVALMGFLMWQGMFNHPGDL